MAKILVIDDSAVIRSLLTDFLTDIGHEVETAGDGDEGVRKARADTYDVCICDMHMPKKNGYQLLTDLGDRKHNMQFIFTDSMPDHLGERISEISDYCQLRKPFDLTQLRTVLEHTLASVKVQ
ncbi:MAG: response regulator [candidate division Zixibacteria bacterium]|nr:response regulator [candidate division Zixibacteria bacterium]